MSHFESASTNSAPKSKYIPPHLRGRGGGSNDKHFDEPAQDPQPLIKGDFHNAHDPRVGVGNAQSGREGNRPIDNAFYLHCAGRLAI